jgi:hypothetical protein
VAVEFVGSVPTEYDVGALELVVGGAWSTEKDIYNKI